MTLICNQYYHRTQTQSATQCEFLFNPSTDIDSYYSYDTRTRQKCFIRTGYSFQPSIRVNSTSHSAPPLHTYRCIVLLCPALLTHTQNTEKRREQRALSLSVSPSVTQVCGFFPLTFRVSSASGLFFYFGL